MHEIQLPKANHLQVRIQTQLKDCVDDTITSQRLQLNPYGQQQQPAVNDLANLPKAPTSLQPLQEAIPRSYTQDNP